jgi:hypothetical protein
MNIVRRRHLLWSYCSTGRALLIGACLLLVLFGALVLCLGQEPYQGHLSRTVTIGLVDRSLRVVHYDVVGGALLRKQADWIAKLQTRWSPTYRKTRVPVVIEGPLVCEDEMLGLCMDPTALAEIRIVDVPAWIVVLSSLAVCSVLGISPVRAVLQSKGQLCPNCGYCRKGTSDRACPECGRECEVVER